MVTRLLPPLLLTAVAVMQVFLTYAAGMTPWKGGGFGMFSTLDHGAHRGVAVVVDAPSRSEEIEIPRSLEDATARAAACPIDWFLRRLAQDIVERERRERRPVTRVTLTAWRIEFDPSTLQATEQPMRTFVYNVP